MSFFFYASSCRRLLGLINEKIDETNARMVEQSKNGEAESELDTKHVENLLRSQAAVEEECKKLEFWSDAQVHLDDKEKAKPIKD
jgi:hypothetical protein